MLAGGDGRLVRRPSVVLFDPSGQNPDIANRFDSAASDQDAVDGLKQYLIESGFNAAPMVVAQWGRAAFDLLVFGDVEVHTSAIAAPMVGGAGSSTWVERRLGEVELGGANPVEIWSGSAADPSTNLGLGVIACAGFRLSLAFGDLDGGGVEIGGQAERSSSTNDRSHTRQPTMAETPAAAAGALVEPVAKATLEVPRAEHGGAASAVVATHTASNEVRPPSVEPDPFTTGTTTGLTAPPRPVAAIPPAAPPTPTLAAESEPPTSSSDQVGAAAHVEPASVDPARTGLIEAAHCAQGHPNPPRTGACYVCGVALLEDQSLGLIEQPTVGRIVFRGGQELAIDRAAMMGRKPDAQALGAHPVLIEHDEVSRSHALLTVEGWTVLLTDQGSRNGTWVTPPNNPVPVRLGERVPHVLEHGTTVYLGAPEVSFIYYFDQQ